MSFGQEKKRKVSSYKSISSRNLKLDRSVPDLLQEAELIRLKNPKGALDRVEEALALSITQGSQFNEAKCYILLGKINQQISEWELAEKHYKDAHTILYKKSYLSTNELKQTLTGLAEVSVKQKKYTQALTYLSQKENVTTNTEQKITVDLDIADVQFLNASYDEVLKSVEKAEVLLKKNPNRLLQSRAQAIKAKVLANKGNVKEAKDLYQQSQAFGDADLEGVQYERNSSFLSIEESKEEIIDAYSNDKAEFAEAEEEEIELRNQSISNNIRLKQPLKVVQEKQALSKALISQGNTSKAIRELQDAAELADSLGNFKELAASYKALAEAWGKQGNSNQSLRYYKKYSVAIDSVFVVEQRQQEEKAKILKKQQGISSLKKEIELDESEYELQETSEQLAKNQRKLIYLLLFLLVIALVAAFLIYRNAMKSKTMSQLLALKSLRSQMNPHFIFNALNSVNQFIAKNDERAANKFLSEFSKLMRLVLDNSQQDFITLAEEKEIIALYLKLEHYRFRDKFEYDFEIDDSLSLDAMDIPPMLIQPYVENAIWHGLRYKEEVGYLKVSLSSEENNLKVTITDNGIGREQSKQLKTENQKKHNSTGLKNTEERINIINKVYQKKYTVTVLDLNEDGTGTRVILNLPQ